MEQYGDDAVILSGRVFELRAFHGCASLLLAPILDENLEKTGLCPQGTPREPAEAWFSQGCQERVPAPAASVVLPRDG